MIETLAAIRFGTGLSPKIPAPRDAAEVLSRLAGTDEIAERFPGETWATRYERTREYVRKRRVRRDGEAEAEAFRRHYRRMNQRYFRDLAIALRRAAETRDGLRERLAWFWADHFAVEDGRGYLRRSVGAYHEEAIRPHVAGRFADLLRSAVTHPAMLFYLDQYRSIGPNSVRARRDGGMNENLAREVLELHTIGVNGTYAQTDVVQLAELLTGLGINKQGETTFRRNHAEPGAETVLGRSYGGDTPDRADITAVLDDLSVHPDTARHLSWKLARHFIADTPPEDLVTAMADTWVRSDGDLMAVYGTLLDHPAAWDPELRKVRRPLDMMGAVARATDLGPWLDSTRIRVLRDSLVNPLGAMGQSWQRPPGPDGWPEDAASWITPQGLAARLEWIERAVRTIDPVPDPRVFVETALGPIAGERTRFAAASAEDRAAGVGLVLASRDFQRR
ncbi:DUF1800 domain-containing protein [Jannaschia marina]|uniref:DUF1800 domain-containing protein n=1 Tax=Jannaschia marina TaxID=2741674 RepID=UPI0015C6CBB2|nr:DUF1800 domain-containing protein [Jannaschia marina]